MTHTFNEYIEMATLSCLFKDGSLYSNVEDLLERNSFGWPSFGIIYKSIQDCVEGDLYPDIVTIQTDLERKGLLEGVVIMSNGLRGRDALRFISEMDVNTEHLESYAFQVIEMRGLRQIISLSEKMRTMVDEKKRPIEILSEMDMESGKIAAHVGAQSKNTRSANDVAQSNLQQLDDAVNGKNLYISTGLKSLDNFIGGLYPSRLYMIAGRANQGKTSLGLNIALRVAEDSKKKVKIFSFESSAEEVQNKLIQIKTGISAIRIEKGQLSKDEIGLYKDALVKIAGLPLLYDDSPELTLALLRTKIRKAVAEGAEVIIIDQLEQVMVGGSGDSQPDHVKFNYIAYRIKAFAREMNVRIILIHQLSRKGETSENRNKAVDPVLSDLYQAGEKAPDAVIMLRTEIYPALFVVKNRQGPKGKIPVGWEGSKMKFTDAENTDSQPDFVQASMLEDTQEEI